jgi:hypothetical protein
VDSEEDSRSSEDIEILLAEIPVLLDAYFLTEVQAPRPVAEDKEEQTVAWTVAERHADQAKSGSAEFTPGNQTEMPGIHPVLDGDPAIDVLIDFIVADLLIDEQA